MAAVADFQIGFTAGNTIEIANAVGQTDGPGFRAADIPTAAGIQIDVLIRANPIQAHGQVPLDAFLKDGGVIGFDKGGFAVRRVALGVFHGRNKYLPQGVDVALFALAEKIVKGGLLIVQNRDAPKRMGDRRLDREFCGDAIQDGGAVGIGDPLVEKPENGERVDIHKLIVLLQLGERHGNGRIYCLDFLNQSSSVVCIGKQFLGKFGVKCHPNKIVFVHRNPPCFWLEKAAVPVRSRYSLPVWPGLNMQSVQNYYTRGKAQNQFEPFTEKKCRKRAG